MANSNAYIGTLEVYNKTYQMKSCQTHFMRHYNAQFPDADAICDKIRITLAIQEIEDLKMQQWYIDREIQSGKICFNLPKETNQTEDDSRIMTFTDAHCYLIKDEYDRDGEYASHLLTIEFVPEKISPEDNVNFELP